MRLNRQRADGAVEPYLTFLRNYTTFVGHEVESGPATGDSAPVLCCAKVFSCSGFGVGLDQRRRGAGIPLAQCAGGFGMK